MAGSMIPKYQRPSQSDERSWKDSAVLISNRAKSVRTRIFPDPRFPAFGLKARNVTKDLSRSTNPELQCLLSDVIFLSLLIVFLLFRDFENNSYFQQKNT